jgi:hypothetical protein
VAGESILVPIRSSVVDMRRLYGLDPVGAFIWHQLDGQRTVGDVAGAVVETFEVDAERALKDAAAYLDDLLRHELVVKRDQG